MTEEIHILGIDPGLRRTGWGVISVKGWHLSHMGHGVICSESKAPLSARLLSLYKGIREVLERYSPQGAAIETSFVQKNAQAALKLGHARAVGMLAVEQAGIPLSEYAPRVVKKAVVGTGSAEKAQMAQMMSVLLPGFSICTGDASDALAIAVCHAHFMMSPQHSELPGPNEQKQKKKRISP